MTFNLISYISGKKFKDYIEKEGEEEHYSEA